MIAQDEVEGKARPEGTAPLIPAEWSGTIGAASIGDVLQIFVSSMLALKTFSLGS